MRATFWYVLPSLPMFLLIPAMLRAGVPFWVSLLAGCAMTVALYLAMTWIGPRFGLKPLGDDAGRIGPALRNKIAGMWNGSVTAGLSVALAKEKKSCRSWYGLPLSLSD